MTVKKIVRNLRQVDISLIDEIHAYLITKTNLAVDEINDEKTEQKY